MSTRVVARRALSGRGVASPCTGRTSAGHARHLVQAVAAVGVFEREAEPLGDFDGLVVLAEVDLAHAFGAVKVVVRFVHQRRHCVGFEGAACVVW